MNLRMTEALLKDNTVIKLDKIVKNRALNEELRCVDCKVRISYVPFSIKKTEHLRASWKHNENCRFNINGLIRNILKKSNGCLTEDQENKFILKMDFEIMKRNDDRSVKKASNHTKYSVATNESLERRLEYYLRTLKRIMELNELTKESDTNDGHDGRLSKRITLSVDGRDVKWGQFYYEESVSTLNKCFKYGMRNVNSVVCIEGKYKIEKGIDGNHYLSLNKPYVAVRNSEGIKEIPSVNFKIPDKSIADYVRKAIESGKSRATVLSTVRCSKSRVHNNDRIFCDIRGEIFNKKQIYFS